jgi:hypothetical protein
VADAGGVVARWAGFGGVGQSAISKAVTATGTDQTAKLAGQLPPTNGNTSGMVSAAGSASPTSSPLA